MKPKLFASLIIAVIIAAAVLPARIRADRITHQKSDVVILYLDQSTIELHDSRGTGSGYNGLYVYNSVSTDPSLTFTNQVTFRDIYGNMTYQSPQESASVAINRILESGYILTGSDPWSQVLRFERR